MAEGLGIAKPRKKLASGGGGMRNKYTPRRTTYYNMMQNISPSMGAMRLDGGLGDTSRSKINNDSGTVPSAYLNYIER